MAVNYTYYNTCNFIHIYLSAVYINNIRTQYTSIARHCPQVRLQFGFCSPLCPLPPLNEVVASNPRPVSRFIIFSNLHLETVLIVVLDCSSRISIRISRCTLLPHCINSSPYTPTTTMTFLPDYIPNS